MNSRERVIKALKHEEPDRVPLALGGSAYNIHDHAYRRLLEYLDLPSDWPPFRQDGFKTGNYLDERVQAALGIDFRYVYQPTPDLVRLNGTRAVNGWGLTLEKVNGFSHAQPTLAGATIKDIENYPWPDPRDYRPAPGTGKRARAYQEAGLAVVARSVCSYGFLEQAGQLRGTEQFMVDMLLDEALARCLVDHIGNTIYGLMEVYLDEVGGYIDILELPGDDYGSQAGPIISPDLFKKYFQPWYMKLVDLVKSKSPGTYVLAHSDGFITPFIPSYIEAGIELLHPLQPGVGMDLAAVKQEFGKDIAFIGGIDIQQALPSGPEAAVEEVKKRLQELAPGGGYILAPANHIGPDVAPESIVAMYRTAAELGRY
ncbi:uroporphyrinogen decarboxylase [Moorella sp. E308F]|uniref:uroporphyrinogen decarboxylase family protein n=1 Tax=unclassified Neomoorella TaxID=2676739 RepID=UPI0010FFBA8B|nr:MULTISPECIES: uroporphyrinogen decarboxylase family protein [unclassified Moorella (in: firmicutes)]GEA14174.1 uroporphyrinogen decarboxylase [Moorella sp. E308F]GEA18441.1 uroporphyrinogen decarboxylase [Moorella sp. E306M]